MIITLAQLTTFFLIFARIAGLFLYAPIFDSKEIMALGKISLIFWLSGLIIFVVPLPKVLPDTPIIFALALVTEVLIGAAIGFTTQLILIGIQFAGTLMDTQAGLSAASILDPYSGQSVTILSKLMRWVAVIIFINFNGHHMLLSAIYQSFKLIPVASPVKMDQAMKLLSSLGTNIFAIALQFSVSILLIVFLIDFCFGMLNKIAPQVNVFALAMQVKPTISFFILMIIMPGLIDKIGEIMKDVTEILLQLLMVMKPG